MPHSDKWWVAIFYLFHKYKYSPDLSVIRWLSHVFEFRDHCAIRERLSAYSEPPYDQNHKNIDTLLWFYQVHCWHRNDVLNSIIWILECALPLIRQRYSRHRLFALFCYFELWIAPNLFKDTWYFQQRFVLVFYQEGDNQKSVPYLRRNQLLGYKFKGINSKVKSVKIQISIHLSFCFLLV